jgi:hypothetical protein
MMDGVRGMWKELLGESATDEPRDEKDGGSEGLRTRTNTNTHKLPNIHVMHECSRKFIFFERETDDRWP